MTVTPSLLGLSWVGGVGGWGGDWEIWASPSVHVAISQSSDLLTQHTKTPNLH